MGSQDSSCRTRLGRESRWDSILAIHAIVSLYWFRDFEMTWQRILILCAAMLACMSFAGCKRHTRLKDTDDTLWKDGELRIIFHTDDYVAPFSQMHGSGTLTRQDWELVELPFSDQPGRSTKRHKLFHVDGDVTQFFRAIEDSDLLIHQVASGSDVFAQRFFLFDPISGKDVSNPFPSAPTERFWFNRSRKACLMVEGNQSVIRDTLSAKMGEPRVLARPPWAPVFERLKYGGYTPVFTEDAGHLVLMPYITSPSYVVASNFTCEVWSTNGSVQKFSLPIERKEGKFVDAEMVDGQILLMWRTLLPNGAEDGVELLNAKGETLYSGKISAFTHGPLWRPGRHEVLFPYYQGTGWDGELWRTYYLWNYASNTVQRISVTR
jgi:hypothetical protein